MRKGSTHTRTATDRAERSRDATKRAIARELMMACILARVWPSYLTTPRYVNAEYPLLLCVSSPSGLLVWRVSLEERPLVEDWLPLRARTTEMPVDRLPILQALAENGW